jgi:glutathione S-transferase
LLSDALGEGDYLLGDFSLVDLAYAPWLPWIDMDEFPRVTAWRERLMAREVWKRCGVAAPSPDRL